MYISLDVGICTILSYICCCLTGDAITFITVGGRTSAVVLCRQNKVSQLPKRKNTSQDANLTEADKISPTGEDSRKKRQKTIFKELTPTASNKQIASSNISLRSVEGEEGTTSVKTGTKVRQRKARGSSEEM
jgi:hypothetical protein